MGGRENKRVLITVQTGFPIPGVAVTFGYWEGHPRCLVSENELCPALFGEVYASLLYIISFFFIERQRSCHYVKKIAEKERSMYLLY
jgi:hypothetical protein